MLHSFAQLYTYTTTSSSSTTSWGALLWLFPIILILAIIEIIALWKIFQKAGRPGWAVIIPFYNYWVLFEISGKPGWWALSIILSVIPFVGWLLFFVLLVVAMLELAKRFGKSTVFAVLGLIIFSFIGQLILGFGDAKYNAGGGTPAPTTPTPIPPTPPAPAV